MIFLSQNCQIYLNKVNSSWILVLAVVPLWSSRGSTSSFNKSQPQFFFTTLYRSSVKNLTKKNEQRSFSCRLRGDVEQRPHIPDLNRSETRPNPLKTHVKGAEESTISLTVKSHSVINVKNEVKIFWNKLPRLIRLYIIHKL